MCTAPQVLTQPGEMIYRIDSSTNCSLLYRLVGDDGRRVRSRTLAHAMHGVDVFRCLLSALSENAARQRQHQLSDLPRRSENSPQNTIPFATIYSVFPKRRLFYVRAFYEPCEAFENASYCSTCCSVKQWIVQVTVPVQ